MNATTPPCLIALVALSACKPLGPNDGPAVTDGIPASLFDPRCLGALVDATADGVGAGSAWSDRVAGVAAIRTYELLAHGEAHASEVLFPGGLQVEIDWSAPLEVQAFRVDARVSVDPAVIADPSLCGGGELQATVPVALLVAGSRVETVWTIASRDDGSWRWRGQAALPPSEAVVEAVTTSHERAARDELASAEVEGAWFTVVEGDETAFTYGIASDQPGHSVSLERGTASLAP